jgi:ATPase subunit of ABC transporter with duplicated ATPase domains
MANDDVIVRFENVSFEYQYQKPILDEVDFSVRRSSKITIMGQNGAGKSTILNLISGDLKPAHGAIHIEKGLTIGVSKQVMPRDQLDLTVRQFFEKDFKEKIYNIDPKIDAVLRVVNLVAPHDRLIKTFSGGQQARLLLAAALIQDPDLLLLDEPTNNLDKAGIEHLTDFLLMYPKSVIVISHDADFLNLFTEGILYLDVFKHKVEQYVGNYYDLLEEISARIEKENRANAQLAKEIQENKEKANFFSHKGGKMRLVAKRMWEKIDEYEEEKVEVRKEDKSIRPFTIPAQDDVVGEVLNITSFTSIRGDKPSVRKCKIALGKHDRLLLVGPNGIGKSTLLESIAKGTAKGAKLNPETRVGYYRQDFSTLNFEDTVHHSLESVMDVKNEQTLRSVAAGFLIGKEIINSKIGSISEGQKGLVAFARLVLEKPGLLILDEPTNHINFRHIDIIAEALDKYEGAMVIVSHLPEFVQKIRVDQTLDLT